MLTFFKANEPVSARALELRPDVLVAFRDFEERGSVGLYSLDDIYFD